MKRSGLLNIVVLLALVAAFLFGIWRAQPPKDVAQTQSTENTSVASANSTTVIIDNFAYYPPVLTVPRGTTVTWINKYPIAHKVTSDGASPNFSSPSLTTGASFTWTFTDPGNFTYYCGNHPGMKGKIVVQ